MDHECLRIRGSPFTVADDEGVAIILKKQTSFLGVWTMKFHFTPRRIGEEAGVTIWWSKWAHARLAIKGCPEGDTVKSQVVFTMTDARGSGGVSEVRLHSYNLD